MDLAIGAKKLFVMMELMTKAGESKLVRHCSYPLTGIGCVSRIYTDMAIFEIIRKECRVVELADGLTLSELEQKIGVKLRYSLS